MSQLKKKRLLTLKEKIDVIEAHSKQKLGVRLLGKKFQIGKTQAANIIKNKEELLQKWNANVNVNQKRSFFKTEGFNIDKLIYEWFVKARSKNIPLSGPIIRSKAKEVAEQLNYQNFNASSGWLERFKRRHNISFKTVSGESGSVNPAVVENFNSKLPSLLRGYNPRDIFNADETGLFYRALPNKTYAFKSEKCAGGKMAKDRLTILPCVNMAGESEKLLVIGKAARPRAFRKLNLNSLPVTWRSNKKAWMTTELMTEFLKMFDKRMGLQKRKVLLFLDNATSHPSDLKLKNVKIHFLPPNTTAFCQPLDQGIIKTFKTFYRSAILKHILSRMDSVDSIEELAKSINVLDVVYFIDKAWQKVTPTTIQNCFRKAGFTTSIVPEPDMNFELEDELPLSIIAEMSKMMKQIAPNNIDFETYVGIDEDLILEDDSLDINFEEVESQQEELLGSDGEDAVQEEDHNCDNCIGTSTEALLTLKKMKCFTSRNGDNRGFQLLITLEDHFENVLLSKKNFCQKKILDFFQPSSQ